MPKGGVNKAIMISMTIIIRSVNPYEMIKEKYTVDILLMYRKKPYHLWALESVTSIKNFSYIYSLNIRVNIPL